MAYSCGYPDTMNKQRLSPLKALDPDYKPGDKMDQDDFEQMRNASGDWHHGDISQNASKIQEDKKGQFITHHYGYPKKPSDTLRPPSGKVFKRFNGKDVFNKDQQRNLYFPKK